MTITEIDNPHKINLKTPKFVCDYILKEIPDPWPKKSSYMVFSGASRSGKSSLIISLLTNIHMYKKAFHSIIVAMPLHSFSSIDNNPFLCLDEDELYDNLEYDTMYKIYNKIVQNAHEEYDTLLYIDDFMSDLKNRNILKLFNMMICNRRHLRLSVWTSTQVYNSIPLSNRKTINYLVIFKPKNRKEIRSVQEEMTTLDPDQFNQVLDYVFDQRFNYLIIDRDNDKTYKMFNEIKIS
jgi:hypothetical protein